MVMSYVLHRERLEAAIRKGARGYYIVDRLIAIYDGEWCGVLSTE